MEKARMAIYSMAGIYILFLSYNMFRGINDSIGNEQILVFAFAIFFAILGVAMITICTYRGYKLMKQSNQQLLEEEEQMNA